MVEITWLGHGTYQFRLTTGEIILVDPLKLTAEEVTTVEEPYRPHPILGHAQPLREEHVEALSYSCSKALEPQRHRQRYISCQQGVFEWANLSGSDRR